MHTLKETGREAPKDNLRLVIACRQDEKKGTGRVIQSLPVLIEKFPGLTLDVIGDGTDIETFKRMAEALNVGDLVTFHGKVNHTDVLRLLNKGDLFCYPTAASEGFPKVVLEALACGLPVITTRVSVLPELIGRGCGMLLDENTPKSLASAVERIAGNAQMYEQMSAKAIETARLYSLEKWKLTIGERLRLAWDAS